MERMSLIAFSVPILRISLPSVISAPGAEGSSSFKVFPKPLDPEDAVMDCAVKGKIMGAAKCDAPVIL